jgi:nucleotidyltransferase substrate binding protein (TIGR01987 family)
MSIIIHGIDISNLIKARSNFERFRVGMQTDRDKAGAIQAFEYCFELSWKTLKRILDYQGVETRAPRDTIREAALNKLISNPEEWFIFLEKRNISSHTYKEENAESVINAFEQFSLAMSELIENMEKLK